MTKSTITRERLETLANAEYCKSNPGAWLLGLKEVNELARIALAAMGSEPHTDDELSNLLWYSQEATCHSDQNYYCEFQRLATPGLIAGIIRELQERRKAEMDSEPVVECEKLTIENFRTAMEGIGHIRRTLDETFGCLHGTHVEPDVLAECKAICDAIYASYRHAHLAPAVPGKWIPVSKQMPPRIPDTSVEYLVYETLNDSVQHDYWNVPEGNRSCQALWNHYGDAVTHWQPLPEPPQEEKP